LAANVYEGMFILDANRYGRDPETVSGQIPAMIEKLGGEMLVSRLWEDRRLAFPIKGQRKGTYWLTYFRLDSDRLGDLRRQCQITDDILRMLFLKVEPRIVDALVTHAKSAPVIIRTAEEEKPAAAGPAVGAVTVADAIDAIDLEEKA
jgi:small subunit ribosomal protein S6